MEPTAAPKAVFLSYASQDTDAARRMAEALRAEGIEVWFDVSELRGGEAWDASIQNQIAECSVLPSGKKCLRRLSRRSFRCQSRRDRPSLGRQLRGGLFGCGIQDGAVVVESGRGAKRNHTDGADG